MKEARQIIAALIKGITPSSPIRISFTELESGILAEQAGQTRLFEITDLEGPIRENLTHGLADLWTETILINVRYDLSGHTHVKEVRWTMERDARCIIKALREGSSSWCSVLDTLRGGHEQPLRETVEDEGGPVAFIISIPITIQFYA